MKKFFFACSILFSGAIFSQSTSTRHSSVYIQTVYHGQPHFSMGQMALINFDSPGHELSMLIDFKNFKSGVDSLDEWLADLSDTKLLLKATVTEEQFGGLHNNESRTLHLTGNLSLNGETHPFTFNFTVFEISQQGIQYQNIQDNYFDRIRFNCSFTFMPKDYKIDKKPHHLKKNISISFGNGFINYVKH